jgi:uncharacterized protein (DUF697 family)
MKKLLLLLFFFTGLTLHGGSSPDFPSKGVKKKETRQNIPSNNPPKAPNFDTSGPTFIIGLGLFIAGISLINPWIAVGIGLGILLLVLILVLLFDADSIKPKGKGVVAKFIAIILGIILGFLLLMLLLFAIILGLALLIGGLIGAVTSPAVGGLVIAGIGALWLLISLLVNWIRKIRYKRYKRTEGKRV